MRGDGPLADRSLLADGHLPAPAGHAPRLEARTADIPGVLISERDADPSAGRWVACEAPMEVRR